MEVRAAGKVPKTALGLVGVCRHNLHPTKVNAKKLASACVAVHCLPDLAPFPLGCSESDR